jgi:electron transfer flavoprotein alpha subunit
VIVAATWEADPPGRHGLELLGAAATLGREAAFVSLGGASGATPDAVVAALAGLARERGARVVLLPADERGGEVAPRLAERLGGTAVTHVVGVAESDGRLVWTRPVFGGKALASVVATVEPVVATVRRGAFEAASAGDAVEVAALTVPPADGTVELLGSEDASSGAALEEAAVIVSGGAGMGGHEGFAELEALARLLGGAVGASLAAVDNGWAPPERQVGLTGKSVSPDVYFAFGISGASQHLAGIGGAKVVVAVNTDPDAPIFRTARLGVVMDGRQLVSALIAELER